MMGEVLPALLERRADLESLCRRLGVRRLYVFGSAARGTFRPHNSDLDLLVEFDASTMGRGYADRYFDLLESLEELFGVRVDLVVASAIRNPYFRESVERSRTLLYAA